ncbi:MFS transporter [Furfurilactobacillus milii]|uniref:MFS transporter n=1 Tax=Furfurilactobacillus milii TaxID=2888272 RepID=A0A6N9HZC2_9LACO|nr:MFS transporter [Furfurilactobacillus milii]MYV16030.1 MFS transporter [Furfurilactobacillus milii]
MNQAPVASAIHTDSQQKWTIASTSAGFALENMDVMFLSFALSSIITELHLSAGQAGMISSVTNLGMLAGGLLFGLLGDRYGRVKIFSYTVFIFAIATTAMAFANSIGWIYLFRFLTGIGAGGEYGVGIALISERFAANKIGRMTSVAAIGGQIGAALAAVLAAVILPTLGWHALFFLGLIPVTLTVIIRRHVHETPVFLTAKRSANTQSVNLLVLFNSPRRAYQTVGLMLMSVVQIAGYFGLMNWLPSIMQKQAHVSVSGSAMWMIATIAGMVMGMFVFGNVLDNIGPRWAFGIFLIGAAISVYIFTLAKTTATILPAGALIGFFSNGMFGGYGAVISELYPVTIRSTANNLIVNVGRAIGGFSSVAIGLLMEHFTLPVVMASLAGLYIFSFIVMLTIPALVKRGVTA